MVMAPAGSGGVHGGGTGWWATRYMGYGETVRILVGTRGMGPGVGLAVSGSGFALFGRVWQWFCPVWPCLALFGLYLALFGPVWAVFGPVWLYWPP